MNDSLTIAKPDYGAYSGLYVVITMQDEEVLESFRTLAEAERWLFQDEEGCREQCPLVLELIENHE